VEQPGHFEPYAHNWNCIIREEQTIVSGSGFGYHLKWWSASVRGMDVLMPIFEYECLACEQQFEHLERANSPQAACPSCGTERVQRLVSLCAVSSESSRASNLSAAHQRAASKRQDKQRSEHMQHHDHFGDSAHK